MNYVHDYYEQRAKRFGFSPELTNWTMFSLTRNAIRANDFKQFEELINEFEKTNFLGELRVSRACSIAQFYLQNKQYDKAIILFTYLTRNIQTLKYL